MWYKKSEHGWRTVVIFNTFSSIINGVLSSVIIVCLASADISRRWAVQFYTPTHLLSRWQLQYLVLGWVARYA